jgi:hypothetical protein
LRRNLSRSIEVITIYGILRLPYQEALPMALSQILVCRDCTASFPLPMESLRGQSVELFGRTAALLTAPCKLPFAQHVHQLDAGEGGLRGVERFEP